MSLLDFTKPLALAQHRNSFKANKFCDDMPEAAFALGEDLLDPPKCHGSRAVEKPRARNEILLRWASRWVGKGVRG